MTNQVCHRPGAFGNRNLFSHSFGVQKFEIEVLARAGFSGGFSP